MHFDFVIIGSNPTSSLLGAMLAKTHGLKIAYLSELAHPLSLTKAFDISIAPITRPKTWKILKDNIGATIDFLNKTSTYSCIRRVDPLLVSTNVKDDTALSHIKNTSAGFGFNIEKQALSDIFISKYKFSDSAYLMQRPFFATLFQRLEFCGVKTFSSKDIKLKNTKNAHAQNITQITGKDFNISAKNVILVGSNALQSNLAQSDIDKHFIKKTISAIMSEPTTKIPSSIIFNLNNDLIIYQQDDGALDCLAIKTKEAIEQKICQLTNDNQNIKLAGKSEFSSLKSNDGAPVIGKIARSKYISICDLGVTGLFQTPAIARFLAGEANEFESEYFKSLAPKSKNNSRSNVAEFSYISANANTKNTVTK
jgi:hypothetical protein